MPVSAPEAQSALAVSAKEGRGGAPGPEPLRIAERRLSLALLQAGKDREATVRETVSLALGLQLPGPGYASSAGSMTAVWVQPGSWLVMAPRAADGDLISRLASASGGAASVVDQTFG